LAVIEVKAREEFFILNYTACLPEKDTPKKKLRKEVSPSVFVISRND
jgi:hypothetical protein